MNSMSRKMGEKAVISEERLARSLFSAIYRTIETKRYKTIWRIR